MHLSARASTAFPNMTTAFHGQIDIYGHIKSAFIRIIVSLLVPRFYKYFQVVIPSGHAFSMHTLIMQCIIA